MGAFPTCKKGGKIAPLEQPDAPALSIVYDTREQRPYDFACFGTEVERGTLATGDYSLTGHEQRAAIERKSLDDLVGCLTVGRARFERELDRGRTLNLFAVVVGGNTTCLEQYLPFGSLQTVRLGTISRLGAEDLPSPCL